MKKYIVSSFLFLSLCFSFLGPVSIAKAQLVEDPLGLSYAADSGLRAHDPRFVAARIINAVLGILGTVAVVLVIYAGFKWMTAGGNDDQVADARKILMAAVIGLVIILSAYSITNFIVTRLYQSTQGTPYGGLN